MGQIIKGCWLNASIELLQLNASIELLQLNASIEL